MDETAAADEDLVSLVTADREIIRGAESGRRYGKAFPTHPCPPAPDDPPGNLVVGPVAALLDRIRGASSHV